MKWLSLLFGIVLVIGGIAYLTIPITTTEQKQVLDIGPLEAYAKEEKQMPVSQPLGLAVIVGGVVLAGFGAASIASKGA